MRYTIEAAVRNHIGRIRKNNEDNFFLDGSFLKRGQMDAGGYFAEISSDKRQLYAVCDGMGGEKDGEEASLLAVERLSRLQSVLDAGGQIRANIDAFCDETNRSILTYGRGGHMGTTLALVCFHEDGCEVAYLGDSRVYLLRDKALVCLTQDHTEVNRLKNMGLISDEEAKNHPDRSMLHKYLGMQYDDLIITPAYAEYAPQEGDRILICSDGLTDMLEDAQIEQTLLTSRTATTATKNLINRALEEGGRDNITAMVLCVRKCDDLPENAPRHGSVRSFSRRAQRARKTGDNWYRQDVDTRKEEMLTAGKKNAKKTAIWVALLLLIALAVAAILLAVGGGFEAAAQLLQSNVKVDNSVQIVSQTDTVDLPQPTQEQQTQETPQPTQADAQQSGLADDTFSEGAFSEGTLAQRAQDLVNEWVAYGATSYQEGAASAQELIRFAFAYAYAHPQEYPQMQRDRIQIPADSVPSQANEPLWTQMYTQGAYCLSQEQLDRIVSLYTAAIVAPSNEYANAVYFNGDYYVSSAWDEAASRVAVAQECTCDEQSGNVTITFDVYAYEQTEGGSSMVQDGRGSAVMRLCETGRMGLHLVSLQIEKGA